MGGRVVIDSDSIAAVKIGFGHIGVVDNKNCHSLWENVGDIQFSGKAYFGPGTKIVNSGKLQFGDGFCITAATDIICYKNISFDSDVLISWDCLIMDSDSHKVLSVETSEQVNEDEAIKIGNHVWIGCRSTILKGVEIPNESVVAAGSILCKKYNKENAIYSNKGIIKENITWAP